MSLKASATGKVLHHKPNVAKNPVRVFREAAFQTCDRKLDRNNKDHYNKRTSAFD